MGCNCKTNEQILRLHKKYGHPRRASWGEKVQLSMENALRLVVVLFLFITFSPIIVILLLLALFFAKDKIRVNKILNFLIGKK